MTTPEEMAALEAAKDQAETRNWAMEDVEREITEIAAQMQNGLDSGSIEMEEMQARLAAMQASEEPQLQQRPSAASNLQPNNATQQQQRPVIVDSRKLIQQQLQLQQQLHLILHAQYCQRREYQTDPEPWQCNLRHCRTTKNALDHMPTCQAGRNCTVSLCYPSRQILDHWNNCTRIECILCVLLKTPLKIWHSSTGGPARVVVGAAQQAPNAVPSDSGVAGVAGNQASATAAAAAVNIQQQQQQQLFGFNEAGQPGGLGNDNSPIDDLQVPVQGIYGWRRTVTPSRRKRLVHELIQAISPNSDPRALLDKKMQAIVLYARKFEGDKYEAANSRSEYFGLLFKRINKLQKEQERRQKLIKQQQQRQELLRELLRVGLRACAPLGMNAESV